MAYPARQIPSGGRMPSILKANVPHRLIVRKCLHQSVLNVLKALYCDWRTLQFV